MEHGVSCCCYWRHRDATAIETADTNHAKDEKRFLILDFGTPTTGDWAAREKREARSEHAEHLWMVFSRLAKPPVVGVQVTSTRI